MKAVITTCILLISFLSFAQEINMLDENGKRHGIWRKNFENSDVLRYEGQFLHGKEVGLFMFYLNIKNKAVLSATKQFNENDNKAYVKFLASSGKVISEGVMDGKKYVGEWKYYQKTNKGLLTVENYTNSGILDGDRIVYYPNGEIAEKQHYKNGKKDGNFKVYSEKNVVLEDVNYLNGELHGEAKFYSPKAELEIEGLYHQGKKAGTWKYYENGKIKEEKDPNKKPKVIKKTP